VASVFREPQINLYVSDIETSLRFYRDVFGFRETFRTPAHGTPIHVELRLGQFTLGLAAIDALPGMHGLATGNGGPPRAEVVLWTDDVDRAYAELMAKGIRSLSEPHDFIGALRGAWVADPDGNPVQIVARLDRG
jgi:catechol 2,3-dioxygenase-like lactoylglutathione lyase family enzyme